MPFLNLYLCISESDQITFSAPQYHAMTILDRTSKICNTLKWLISKVLSIVLLAKDAGMKHCMCLHSGTGSKHKLYSWGLLTENWASFSSKAFLNFSNVSFSSAR